MRFGQEPLLDLRAQATAPRLGANVERIDLGMGRVGQVNCPTGRGEARVADKQHDGRRTAVAGAQNLDPAVVLKGQKVLCRDAKPARQTDVPGATAFSQHADLRKVVFPRFNGSPHTRG